LFEKNLIKLSEKRENLMKMADLNEIYELFWEISEGQRNGTIYFSYPLEFNN